MHPLSHSLGSHVLDRTVVGDINPCCLGSILENNLGHKTIYSRKIELNKLIYIKEVKKATTLEVLFHLFYKSHMKCFNQ